MHRFVTQSAAKVTATYSHRGKERNTDDLQRKAFLGSNRTKGVQVSNSWPLKTAEIECEIKYGTLEGKANRAGWNPPMRRKL